MAGYTFLELQDEVLAYGFDSTQYRARVKRWLNEAQHLTVRRVPHREQLTSAQLTVDAAGGTITGVPADMARIESMWLVRGAQNVRIHPITADQAPDFTPPGVFGEPRFYYAAEGGLSVAPLADQAYMLTMYYQRDGADMTGDTDVPLVPPAHQHVLVSYAVSRAFRAEDDQERAAAFMADYERGLITLAADRRGEDSDGPKQVPGMWATFGDPGDMR